MNTKPSELTYQAKVNALGPLEEFAPEAFLDDIEYPASLCRLILTLAVVHNDMNDLDLGLTLLQTQKPLPPVVQSRQWAIFNSIGLHVAKRRVALVHELLVLVRNNEQVFALPAFAKLHRALSKNHKDAWQEVVDAAAGQARDTKLGKFLAVCRDKVANHYDAKVLHKAYQTRFPKDSKSKPLLSRGNSMFGTKFFFADAAVEDVLLGGGHTDEAHKFLFQDNALMQHINVALFFLVTRFVTLRGYGWKRIREGDAVEKRYFD